MPMLVHMLALHAYSCLVQLATALLVGPTKIVQQNLMIELCNATLIVSGLFPAS
jgi:hypothetical protein